MSLAEKYIAVVITTALLISLWIVFLDLRRVPHPHLMEQEFGCIHQLVLMESHERALLGLPTPHDEELTLLRIRSLAEKGCSECDECTNELLEYISDGEDVWGRQLQLRRVEADDDVGLYEVRSVGANGQEDGRGGDDVVIRLRYR